MLTLNTQTSPKNGQRKRREPYLWMIFSDKIDQNSAKHPSFSLLSFPPYSVRHSLLLLREVPPAVDVILPPSPSSAGHPQLSCSSRQQVRSLNHPPAAARPCLEKGSSPFSGGPLPLKKNIMESPEKSTPPGPHHQRGLHSIKLFFISLWF